LVFQSASCGFCRAFDTRDPRYRRCPNFRLNTGLPFSPFPAAQGHAQHAPIEALAAFLNVAGDPDFQRPMWQVLLGHEGLRKLSGQLCQDGVDLVWSDRFPLITEAAPPLVPACLIRNKGWL
jgi:hypothetical protein